VLYVQHLVKQNIFNGARRDARSIHPAIQKNLIRPGIVTAELPAPASGAPSNVRPLQLARKVFSIELVEKSVQVKMFSARTGRSQANASAAHPIHTAARAVRTGVLEIRLCELSRSSTPIDARQQERSRAFQHGPRRSLQEVGKAHVNHFFSPPDCQHQAGVGIKLDAEARRPAIATQPREHALKKGPASRHHRSSAAARFHRFD
jgi:hypothetical protein